MAQQLDELLIRISAETKGLQAALDGMDRRLAQSGEKGKAAIGKLDGATALLQRTLIGIGGTAALGGFVGIYRRAIDAAGGLGELADQAGITTDQLQVLEYAAVQAGVGTEQALRGMEKLTQRLGDAASGNKEAVRAFRALGVEFLDLEGNARPTGDVLADVADRIAALPTPAARAAAAIDVFGKSGQKLLPILQEGSVGLRRFEESARKAGAIISAEDIKKADDLGDKLARLTLEWDKLLQTVAAGSAPVVSKGLDLLLGMVTQFDKPDLKRQLLDLDRSLEALRGGFDGLDEPGHDHSKNAAAIASLIRARMDLVKAISGAEAVLAGTGGSASNGGAPSPTVAAPPSFPIPNRHPGMDAIERFDGRRQDQAQASAQERLAAAMGMLNRDLAEAERVLKPWNEQMEKGRRLTEAMLTPQERYNATMLELEVLLADGAIGLETFQRAAAEAGRTLEEATDKSTALREAAADLGWSFSSAFEDAILNGQKLSSVLDGLLKDMARIMLRMTVTQPIASAIASALGAPVPQGRALGGPVSAGVPYLVGEHGRELFVPSVPGRIVPNNRTSGPSVVVQQTLNIGVGVAQTVRAEMLTLAPAIADAAAAKVADAVRRGGSFSSAVRGY